jgi:beta-hydroxylase
MVRWRNEMEETSVNRVSNFIRLIVEAVFRWVDGDKTFYDTNSLGWVQDFQQHFPKIKQELLQVLSSKDPIPEWETLSNDPNVKIGNAWKVFIFKVYNNKIQKNYSQCPITGALIDKYPQISTAWFSILEPNQEIPLHRGPYNGVLRYHLGLIIPNDALNCGIMVGNETRHWQEGESLLFDDTHLHMAWNYTNQIRVVLFMDIIRPLPFPLNILNKLIIRVIQSSSYTRNVVKKAQ